MAQGNASYGNSIMRCLASRRSGLFTTAALCILICALRYSAMLSSSLANVKGSVASQPNNERAEVKEEDGHSLSEPSTTGGTVGRDDVKSKKKSNAKATPVNELEYKIVFSTDCSPFQHWQAYAFFYQALVSKQPGTVTRIVSGCETDVHESNLRALFDEQILPMAPGRFKLHFTPDYSKLATNSQKYYFFNKPYGIRHWLENALGHGTDQKPVNEDAIVILMDPDQLIMRPFTDNNFSNTEWKFVEGEPRTKVEHGKPMGELYLFGMQWRDAINMTAVEENSRVPDIPFAEAQAGYMVGPPYIATARDMYTIAKDWSDFAVPVHTQYPHLLAEMFAYSLAAAHNNLPHQTATSFMLSHTGTGASEGWNYIDKLPDSAVCGGFSPDQVPNVMHFCQRYGLGKYFFYKRNLPNNFLTCDSPLLVEPPQDIGSKYSFAIYPDGKKEDFDKARIKRNAFAVCFLTQSLNAAAQHFKRRHCDETTVNFEKKLIFFDSLDIPE